MTAAATEPAWIVHRAGQPQDGVQCCSDCGQLLAQAPTASADPSYRPGYSRGQRVAQIHELTPTYQPGEAVARPDPRISITAPHPGGPLAPGDLPCTQLAKDPA